MYDHTDQELIDELKRVNKQVDGQLSMPKYRERSELTFNAHVSRFGSWNAAKEAAGLEIHEANHTEADEEKNSYRVRTLKQKINVCNVCGTAEKDLVVHHINGDRTDNDLENLIPLCHTCHRKVHTHQPHNKVLDQLTEQLDELPLVRDKSRHWDNRDKNL